MAVDVEIIADNTDEVYRDIYSAIQTGLERIGQVAERYAAERAHVKTGRLKASISHATKITQGRTYNYKDDDKKAYSYEIGTGAEENTVYIGTNVEYAPFVEKRYPYLKPAAAEHMSEYKDLLEKYIGRA